MKTFTRTDKLILYYNGVITLHILISATVLPFWIFLVLAHSGIFIFLYYLVKNDNGSTISNWVHIWYPMFLFLWFYPEVGLLRHTVIPFDLDDLLLKLETTLFPLRYYFTVPLSLSELSLEMFHGFYFSYYLLLFLPALIAYKNKRNQVSEYIYILSITMMIHYGFQIIFPTSGPVYLRQDVMPDGIFFIPVMDWIYQNIDQGGSAFPSTHVAASLVSWRYSSKFFPHIKYMLFAVFVFILLSTVICTFHYVIDSIAGILTGFVCYAIGKKTYGAHSL